jgi:sulfate permease, SulP family
MTGRRHRSNAELVAQGIANIGSALFGGICVTGTIARTATNVRAGARGPFAGMLHSLFLLLFVVIAAPLASYIPLAALAAVLCTVAWNMAERHQFATLLRASRGDAVILLATFLLVVFRDLTEGIVVGFCLGTLLFLHRMAQAVEVRTGKPVAARDVPDLRGDATRQPYDAALATDRDVIVYHISGAFFFGAAATVAAALDRIGEHPRAFVIDFSAVSVIDSTAAATIEGFVRKARRNDTLVYISGAEPGTRRMLLMHGVRRRSISRPRSRAPWQLRAQELKRRLVLAGWRPATVDGALASASCAAAPPRRCGRSRSLPAAPGPCRLRRRRRECRADRSCLR